MQPVVSVVLCVRNGAATLGRQLDALARQDMTSAWEVVVVDNGSVDGSGDLARSWTAQLGALRVVAEPRPGVNRARNRGVAEARADRILHCDADDEVAPAWVRTMAAGLDRFDVVGGALVARRGPPARVRALGVPQADELPSLLDHRFAVGASLGYHRRVHEEIGGFDETFAGGGDEVDFCMRAVHAGFRIGFVPDAVTQYTLHEAPGAVARQWFAYGRGLQRLLATTSARGWFVRTPRQRWRDLAAASAPLLWTWPSALVSGRGLAYLARVAHVAGEVTELVALTWRGARWFGAHRRADQFGRH